MAQDIEAATDEGRFEVEEVVVTAQRRAESLQNVPVAVSAFSEALLRAQKVDGGPNLQLAVPNISFSMGTRGPNFQIRGIGTKQFSAMGDTSTGVHLNNVPLTDNRLFEAEFFDVERVEVLRGPQGTLYGRNATGGVVNVITAKPTNEFEGAIRAEVGNFQSRKLGGMLNIPLVDERLALRVAGNYVVRDGFVTNTLDGSKLDGRDLYSFRATLAFHPTDTIETSIVWQRFREDDDRILTGKSLCVRDPGPASVGGVGVTNPLMRGFSARGA